MIPTSRGAYEAECFPFWLCASTVCGGSKLRRLTNLFALYETGRKLGSFRAKLVGGAMMNGTIGTEGLQCIGALEYLINGDAIPIPKTKEAARSLLKSIHTLLAGDDVGKQRYDEYLNAYFIGPIKDDINTFQFALSEELKDASAFFIEVEGNLSTEKLIRGAHYGYPEHVNEVISQQAKDEIDESGRCVVFERPTAAGFHILRAVELIIKQYLAKIPGFIMPPLNRQNWGEYIRCLKDNGASKEVTDTLQGIKDNHRNPLMHPDDTLTQHEAVSLFSICQSMVEALIKDMDTRGFITK
jgi:hypothetical protein